MNGFKRYLGKEIGIGFKACLYFFVLLFFYCCYRVFEGHSDASILIMAEMILSTYFMGYIQVYLLRNFDEADELTPFVAVAGILCTLIYTAISYVGKWFDRNIGVTIGFFFYLLFAYFCVLLVYKFKREADTKELNENLEKFKKEREESEDRKV